MRPKQSVQCHWCPEILAFEAFSKADVSNGCSFRRKVVLHPFTQVCLPRLVQEGLLLLLLDLVQEKKFLSEAASPRMPIALCHPIL